MRILVTGGAGFIGSAVIRHCLSSTAHEIVNVDDLTYAANLENLRQVESNPKYAFERANICDFGAMTRILETYDPEVIMHLAAESHVDRSIDGPGAFIETNIIGTYTLLQATRRHYEKLDASRRRSFRFHHVSTDEVFGTLGQNGFFTETTPYAPNSPYSASKASSDMLVRAWNQTFDLPVVISNCSNNYGPFQFPEKLIPVAILAALEGKGIPVYGTGMNVRDWLYVEDHARALLAVIESGQVGESYNVGGNSEAANIDLVRLLCRLLDEAIPSSVFWPHEQLITFVADRPGHDARYAIDASKIERELGWRPRVSMEEGLRRTVKWYLENRAWWQNIRSRGHKATRLGMVTASDSPVTAS